ncbi:MAG: sigma-54-dependent Fis family transcriptional regulator [candidate division Zixibacteria bacterium]|nr:sigma-54-dependent Fis family transcriptional regulator [candidate division Zixibacteria bacterium]
MKYSVLIVDDDRYAVQPIAMMASHAGYESVQAFSGEEALLRLKERPFDIVLTDLKMGEMDGISVLEHAKRLHPDCVVVLMTGYGTVEKAVAAMKKGAYDFVLKPLEPVTVENMLQHITEVLRLRLDNAMLRTYVTHTFQNMVGKSKAMKDIFDTVQSVATARSTILITGDSGVGKELVSRAIHYCSERSDGPFVKLNCAALPETLVEAELFGYEKGAFTDAKRAHRGKFEVAHEGTLLLDEISEMPLNLQSKLLRVIQEREFDKIGSDAPVAVDVRVIATSNRNLKEFVAQGKFRDDLYYRLNVIPIHIPPLRERPEDIPLMVERFVDKFSRDNKRPIKSVDQQVYKLFMGYSWPGNVRELENMIERAVVTTKSETLTTEDFPVELAVDGIGSVEGGLEIPMTLDEGNKYLILKTLEKYEGNKTRAADALGVSSRTIRNKLAEWRDKETTPAEM